MEKCSGECGRLFDKLSGRPCLRWRHTERIFLVILHINGEDREFRSPLSLAELLESLGMKAGRVAVELNRDIVPRERWVETVLAEGDRLEIVHFVGGG